MFLCVAVTAPNDTAIGTRWGCVRIHGPVSTVAALPEEDDPILVAHVVCVMCFGSGRVVGSWLGIFKTVVSALSEEGGAIASDGDEVARGNLTIVARIWRHLYPAITSNEERTRQDMNVCISTLCLHSPRKTGIPET